MFIFCNDLKDAGISSVPCCSSCVEDVQSGVASFVDIYPPDTIDVDVVALVCCRHQEDIEDADESVWRELIEKKENERDD